MDKLYTKAYIEKEGDNYVAVASTEVEDRQGEVVEVSGWDLKAFKQNPILLLFHDHHSLPVGKAARIWTEKSTNRLMFKPVFEEITDRGKAIAQLVREGFLKTFSVGFRPIDSDENRYTKQELLEISLVNVPANPQAMMLSYKSLKESGFKNKTIAELGIPAPVLSELEQIKSRLDSVEELADSAVKGLKYLNPQQGSKGTVNADRHLMTKVIDKAATMLLTKDLPQQKVDSTAKLIKRTSELLILSHKDENGKN